MDTPANTIPPIPAVPPAAVAKTPPETLAEIASMDAARDKKGKAKYALEYPVITKDDAGNEVEITELWMRRPTLFDKVVAERQSKDPKSYEATATMLANVCAVNPDVIWDLDEELDLTGLVAVFNGLEEAPEIENNNTLKLRYPFEIDGKLIDSLTVRRPRARDTLEFKDESVGEKLARLCGYSQSDLNKIDLKSDWMGLEQIYVSFRKRKSKR